jgi:diketogulonate reductase-like aldo/keto reductase
MAHLQGVVHSGNIISAGLLAQPWKSSDTEVRYAMGLAEQIDVSHSPSFKHNRHNTKVTVKLFVGSAFSSGSAENVVQSVIHANGIKQLDLLLIQLAPDVNLDIAWKELEQLHDKGLVRELGIVNFPREEAAAFHAGARIKPAVLQLRIADVTDDLVKWGIEHDVALTAHNDPSDLLARAFGDRQPEWLARYTVVDTTRSVVLAKGYTSTP